MTVTSWNLGTREWKGAKSSSCPLLSLAMNQLLKKGFGLEKASLETAESSILSYACFNSEGPLSLQLQNGEAL